MTTSTAISPVPSGQSILQNAIAKQTTAAAIDAANIKNGLTSDSSSSASRLTGDFNTFLKILTTQLQNQDPLAATDVNEFTRELVQFSGVEQQINTNKKLDSLISSSSAAGMTPLLGYVGKYIEAPAAGQIALQDGSASMSYSLPSEAQSLKVTITNSSGKTIATLDGPTSNGTHKLTWDGRSALGGTAEDGVYNMKIQALDPTGKPMTINNVTITGKATGIQTGSDGAAIISIDGIEIDSDSIRSVYLSAPKA